MGHLQSGGSLILASVANRGFLYTKDVACVTQLFFERGDGTVLQIS